MPPVLTAASSQVPPAAPVVSAGASVVVSPAARPTCKVTLNLPTIIEAEAALTAPMRAAGRGEQIPAGVRRAIEAAMEGLDNPFDDAADAQHQHQHQHQERDIRILSLTPTKNEWFPWLNPRFAMG